MVRRLNRLSILILVFASVMAFSPAAGQETDPGDGGIDALIQEFLPEGRTMGNASVSQIENAISQAVSAEPENAVEITRRGVHRRPDQAVNIARAAAGAAPPEASVDIAIAAALLVPYRSSAIIVAISQVAPAYTIVMRDAVYHALQEQRQEIATTTLDRTTMRMTVEGASPPMRDDNPFSPVQP